MTLEKDRHAPNRPVAPLQIAVLQTDAVTGDIEANVAGIASRSPDVDLVVTPELSLTGYDVRDAVHELSLPFDPSGQPPRRLAPLFPDGHADTLVGLVEAGDDGIPYNSVILLSAGRIRHCHRKIYLPTYGLFDEGRFFGRGDSLGIVELKKGWLAAVLICEDLWHPALSYLAAMSGAHVLIVAAAAPGRGVLEGGANGGTFASWIAWQELVRVTARTHGCYVVLANRAGVEDGVTFAGGSVVASPDGSTIRVAPECVEHSMEAVLDPAELARARTPYAHIRDEDPSFLLRALERLGAAV
jgi:predicted amidohydrolase